MTQVTEIQAGPELDSLIARLVFGNTVMVTMDSHGGPVYQHRYLANPEWGGYSDYQWDYLPQYSTDIGAAWLVVEKMREMADNHEINSLTIEYAGDEKLWYVQWNQRHGGNEPWRSWQTHSVRSETPPLAICRAALAALGAET